MIRPNTKSPLQIIIFCAVVATVIATPFSNKDALIIPKVITIFFTAMYILPNLLRNRHLLDENRLLKLSEIVLTLLILQLVLSSIFSKSPIDQILYGRTGRGFGLFTLVSLVIITMAVTIYITSENLDLVNFGVFVSGTIVIVYGFLQYLGLDAFGWVTKSNGIISTLGNPNFVSSFISFAFIPSLVFLSTLKFRVTLILGCCLVFLGGIYIAESTQGYVTLGISLSVFLLIYLRYKNKMLFVLVFVISFIIGFLTLLGSLNKGPLALYLYKVSVQSRGDFWRSALETFKSSPYFGYGPDSFGDYFLKFRDEVAVAHPFAEYTDSAHNYFLDYGVIGGFPLIFLNLLLLLFAAISFKSYIKSNEFNSKIAAIYSALAVYVAQSIISPMNLAIVLWGSILLGAVIGLNRGTSTISTRKLNQSKIEKNFLPRTFLLIFSCTIMFPYFNADRMQLTAIETRNGDLVIESTLMYPKSTVRFYTMTRELFDSGLTTQALYLANEGVKFNPQSPSLWALIMVNPSASIVDRQNAQKKILTLDPLNKDVINYFDYIKN